MEEEMEGLRKLVDNEPTTYVCEDCSIEFSPNDFENHVCCYSKDFFQENSASSHDLINGDIIYQPGGSVALDVMHTLGDAYISAEVVELTPEFSTNSLDGDTVVLETKNDIEYMDQYSEPTTSYASAQPKKRKKHNNNDYLKNKLVRDPYFKLDNNSYNFKETLGDWNEKSTKLLIAVLERHPKAHFLLQYYYERRLLHWENIQKAMHTFGYNFTVLQLRMRWREVLGKYRWTLNHNDLFPNDQKDCEYKSEMDGLFGIWDTANTNALINCIEKAVKNSPSAKHKQLSHRTWEVITSDLLLRGIDYGTMQVEARWRMLVTLYKSMVDHNDMPTVEPIKVAYSDRLKELVPYTPRRRKDYEKYKGKKIKLEKFPESGMKTLIKIYKNHAEDFANSTKKNGIVWDEIHNELTSHNYNFPLKKMKEIFFATLKLHERSIEHNSIPGAIKREGPYFDELNEIRTTYGIWPHIKRRVKSSSEKSNKRFSIKLRESMQTWTTEDSAALLHLYPLVLQNHITPQSNKEFWSDIAKHFGELGREKRSIPAIATHISLLRKAYKQGNKFPFQNEMENILKVEGHLGFIPDTSKYIGDSEIMYWSHEAIYLMLDLYLEIQPLLPFSSFSGEVHQRISKEMNKYGYMYTGDDVSNELRSLLFQFTLQRHKIERSSEEDWGKQKSIAFYSDRLRKVMKLRDELSVKFTNGVKPIPLDVAELAYYVARQKAELLFVDSLTQDEQEDRMKLLVLSVRREIKRVIGKKPPIARKICVLLSTGLENVAEGQEQDEDLIGLYEILRNYEYQSILSKIMKETHNGSYRLPRNVLDIEKHMEKNCGFDQHESDNICSILIKEEEEETQVTVDDSSCNYLVRDNGCNVKSVIFVDEGLSTKTTVQQVPDQPDVTCIKIENID